MTRDALTHDEIRAYRRVYPHFRKEHPGRYTFGVRLAVRSRYRMWRFSVLFGGIDTGLTFQTRAAYENYLLSLGPHRNA